jgi:O-antigen ligase
LGFGIQSANAVLIEKYQNKKFELGIAEQYNAHNTYLQVGLHCGILGIIVLLLLLGMVIRKAIVQRNFFLLFTLLLIIPQSITESMFEVQKGIIFFVVFISLFANHAPGTTNISSTKEL